MPSCHVPSLRHPSKVTELLLSAGHVGFEKEREDKQALGFKSYPERLGFQKVLKILGSMLCIC